MSSSFRIFHGHNSVFARFSAEGLVSKHADFYIIKIASADITVSSWETRKNWVMPMQCPKTRRHYLEHVWKLVGGVVPNTPPGGPELEHFTSVEGHRSNLSGNDCIHTNSKITAVLLAEFRFQCFLPLFCISRFLGMYFCSVYEQMWLAHYEALSMSK